MSERDVNVVIAGGGFFGCTIAMMLHRRGLRPLVVEAEDELLTRASRVNQARVHGGYHYPRSLMTAYRSRHNYERFRSEYREAIVDKFTKIYGVHETDRRAIEGSAGADFEAVQPDPDRGGVDRRGVCVRLLVVA